jgi:hypothetical protein
METEAVHSNFQSKNFQFLIFCLVFYAGFSFLSLILERPKVHYPDLSSRQKSEIISDNCEDHKNTGRYNYMNIDTGKLKII